MQCRSLFSMAERHRETCEDAHQVTLCKGSRSSPKPNEPNSRIVVPTVSPRFGFIQKTMVTQLSTVSRFSVVQNTCRA